MQITSTEVGVSALMGELVQVAHVDGCAWSLHEDKAVSSHFVK